MRSIAGLFLGKSLNSDDFPFPWNAKPKAKRKPLTEQERKERIEALRKGLAEEITNSVEVR